MNTVKVVRFVLGVAVSIGVLLVLDLVPWKSDAGQLSPVQLYFVLGAMGAISVGVATFAGAIIARVNFVAPAILLACAAWYLAGSYVQTMASSNGSTESTWILLANLSGLALTFGGAIIGALVGRRLSKENEGNDSIAA
ncbi:MAG: hypothetical protein KJO19_11505 [Woeseia sp.]|nr:hypothetical protein [Woeseia sp.]